MLPDDPGDRLPPPMRAMARPLALLLLLLVPLPAQAQAPRPVPRVGYLSSTTAAAASGYLAVFQEGLREQGHAPGQTILVEPRYADGRFERLHALAADLVQLKVDVLVAGGAPAARAAKQATGTVPIVMAYVADPVGLGLVASLARPGGNVTGLSDFNAGVVVKRLELLREVVPAVTRVAALLNPTNPTNPLQFQLARAAAPSLGVMLATYEARQVQEIDRAFAAMAADRQGGLIVIGDPFLGAHRPKILDLAARGRLPAIYSFRAWAEEGGLMAYGADFNDLHRRAALYVDRILRGANPAELPVEQPTKFELAVNLKTARALGLTIPRTLLLRADRAIE